MFENKNCTPVAYNVVQQLYFSFKKPQNRKKKTQTRIKIIVHLKLWVNWEWGEKGP